LHVPAFADAVLVHPPETVFRILSAMRTPPKLLLGANQTHTCSHGTIAPRGLCLFMRYTNRHIDIDKGEIREVLAIQGG